MGNTNINCITNYSNKVKILIEVVQCIWLYYPLDIFCSRLYIALQFCVCLYVFLGIQILQIQMCQKLQEEAKSKKNKMDQSIQKGIRKGTDSGEIMN